MPPSPRRRLPRRCQSLRSTRPLRAAMRPGARKVYRRASPAIFSFVKVPPPFVPTPPPTPPHTPKHFRHRESRLAPPPPPQTAWPSPPVFHLSFRLAAHQRVPPLICFRIPAKAKNSPVAENNPLPSRSPSSAPAPRSRFLPVPRRN